MKLPKYIIKAYKLKSIKKGTAIELEEVEGIPVEWINEWIEKHKDKGSCGYFVRWMIEDWRKEND